LTNQDRSLVSAQELRTFGLIFGVLVSAIFGLLFPLLAGSLWQTLWPWYLGGAVILLALIWPVGLKPLYRAWMKFGDVAGWVNTRIILFLLFYGIILPVGLIMKIVGSDPMRRKICPDASSYRIIPPTVGKNHMERPY
jgi:hypothetical protein